MRKLLVAAVVLVLLVGGAVAAVPLIERHAAAQIKADMERDGTTTVGTVEVGLFERRLRMTALHSKEFGDITIGRWQASGLAWPLAELVKGRTPLSGLQLGDPLHAARLEVSDVRGVEARATWSIGSLAIDDFSLERYEPPPAGTANRLIHLGSRIVAALSMARLEQKDTVFTDIKGDTVKLDTLTIGRFEKGLVGSLAVAGLEVVPNAAKAPFIHISDLKLDAFDLRRPFTTMGRPEWRPGLPVGRVDLGAAKVTGFGGEAFTRYGLSLGSISSETRREGQDVRRSRLRIEGFVLAPPLRGLETLQLRLGLQAMGLKELRLELDCTGTEDRARGEASVDRCVLAGPDLGEIDLSFKVVGADEAFWRAVDDSDTIALLRSKAGLGGARLVVADRGLVERSLRLAATTSGQPLAALRAGIAQEVRRFQPPGVLITEDMTRLLDTVARFVETGGTLTLEAKPERPVGLDKLDYFRRPGPDLVNLLGLSATLSR